MYINLELNNFSVLSVACSYSRSEAAWACRFQPALYPAVWTPKFGTVKPFSTVEIHVDLGILFDTFSSYETRCVAGAFHPGHVVEPCQSAPCDSAVKWWPQCAPTYLILGDAVMVATLLSLFGTLSNANEWKLIVWSGGWSQENILKISSGKCIFITFEVVLNFQAGYDYACVFMKNIEIINFGILNNC